MNNEKSQKTIVIFRKYPNGEILALFPEIPCSSPYLCSSYLHIGQHGDANYRVVLKQTKPIKKGEALELEAELRRIGYNLDVKERLTQVMWNNLIKNYKEMVDV